MPASTEPWLKKKCKPCEGGVKPLSEREARSYLNDIKGWQLSADARRIGREYVMKHFQAALDLIREIGRVAEEENHPPDLHLTGYRKLRVELSTHAIGGLSENDFIVAAKIEALPKDLKH